MHQNLNINGLVLSGGQNEPLLFSMKPEWEQMVLGLVDSSHFPLFGLIGDQCGEGILSFDGGDSENEDKYEGIHVR